MADFVKVGKLSELEEGKIKAVVLAGEQVALYKIGGEIFATSNICTHEACELAENGMIEEGDSVVECLCHGSHFKIKTGEVTSPPAAEPLRTYRVKVEEEEVFIELGNDL